MIVLLHPVQSMFLGAIPMGLATLINGLVLFGVPHWGEGMLALAHGLWWLDVALALGVALLVPYLMFTRQDHALEKLTAVWLLPIVAPEVAAAAAGVLAPHLEPQAARLMLVTGYLLWGVSLSLAFSLITLVLLRLALHKLPGSEFAGTVIEIAPDVTQVKAGDRVFGSTMVGALIGSRNSSTQCDEPATRSRRNSGSAPSRESSSMMIR